MLILNFKTYPESTGENANKLLKAITNLIKKKPELGKLISCAPSMLDLSTAKKQYRDINIMSQHVDTKLPGSSTGWITPENLLLNEIQFSIYNHSEHRVWSDSIIQDIKDIQAKGIKLIVCCENVEEAKKLLEGQPYGIAFEPRELIGSGVSVTTRPDSVAEFTTAINGQALAFIGAGVTNGEDIRNGMELGADGALLASAFVRSPNPEEKALELVEPLLKK